MCYKRYGLCVSRMKKGRKERKFSAEPQEEVVVKVDPSGVKNCIRSRRSAQLRSEYSRTQEEG